MSTQPTKSTKIIGLTGQSGAGKTTVSLLLKDRGYRIIDADLAAREVIEGSTDCLTDLVLEFTTEIITPEASLNREKLAKLVFTDPVKLKRLNAITYPYIMRELRDQLRKARDQQVPVVILDAPTLFEAGADKLCDGVIAVIAPKDQRLERIVSRDSISRDAALERLNAQQEDAFYTEKSNAVLTNTGDLQSLKQSLFDIMDQLLTGDAPGK